MDSFNNKNSFKRQKSISYHYNRKRANLLLGTPKLNLNLYNSKEYNINNFNNQDIINNNNNLPLYSSNKELLNEISYKFKPSLKNVQINNYIDENKNEKNKVKLNLNKNIFKKRLSFLSHSNTNNNQYNFTHIKSTSNTLKRKNTFNLNLRAKENDINNYNISDYLFKNKINYTKKYNFKRNSTIFQSRNNLNINFTTYNTTNVNPLLILEEDKIFDERKKYLFYKYENKKNKKILNNKTEYKFKKKVKKDNINIIALKIKKLKQRKKQLLNSDKKRLNYLYLSTNQVNKKLKKIKNKKDKQNLREYQSNLLGTIKPSISDYGYITLKERLYNLRAKSEIKENNTIKKMKEIEMEEKAIINEFNEIGEKYLKIFDNKKPKININCFKNKKSIFPLIHFTSCFNEKINK